MNLARHSITATKPVHILDARFDPECHIFTTATPAGFAVYRTWPMKLIRKRELTGGTLSVVVPLHTSSLLFLVGGGRSPLYPPNKVILWDDAIGAEVAELEFREKVRGLACRRGWLAVSLRRRVVVFQITDKVTRYGEWDTCDNPRGLIAIATESYATLLAIAGRQMGHVQLIHLPPCPPPTPKDPPPSLPPRKPPPLTKHPGSFIPAHETALTTLCVPPSGRLLATTSSRGTLVRVWDSHSGKLIRTFRRGTDKAEIYGVAFRPDERELCVWSDKGTIHVFSLLTSGASNRQSSLAPLTPFLPLPKYFDSEWSYAQYRIPTQSSHISLTSASNRESQTADIPDEERCVVGWITMSNDNTHIPEYQLIALTYVGGWYRLALPGATASVTPQPSSSIPSGRSSHKAASIPRQHISSAASTTAQSEKGKGKEREGEKDTKPSSECMLQEYRRFGRWDGWS